MIKKETKNSSKKIAYNNRWTNAHFDRISVAVPVGDKDRMKAAADAVGQSVNAYIVTAVRDRMEKEKEKGGTA